MARHIRTARQGEWTHSFSLTYWWLFFTSENKEIKWSTSTTDTIRLIYFSSVAWRCVCVCGFLLLKIIVQDLHRMDRPSRYHLCIFLWIFWVLLMFFFFSSELFTSIWSSRFFLLNEFIDDQPNSKFMLASVFTLFQIQPHLRHTDVGPNYRIKILIGTGELEENRIPSARRSREAEWQRILIVHAREAYWIQGRQFTISFFSVSFNARSDIHVSFLTSLPASHRWFSCPANCILPVLCIYLLQRRKRNQTNQSVESEGQYPRR